MDPSGSPLLSLVSNEPAKIESEVHTFEVKEHIWLIVLEHLRNQLHIHVLNVDFLDKTWASLAGSNEFESDLEILV